MSGFMVMQVWQEDGVDARRADGDGIYPMSSVGFGERIGQDNYPGFWWARYSAPGYMDATEPVYASTACEAAQECFALYGDEESLEERSELASVLWQCRKLDRKAK